MHELAIAESIVGIVCAHAGERRVTRIELKVGHLRQVVPEALAFAFALMAEGTPAAGAELRIAEVPIVAECRACAAERALPGLPLLCPACGGADLRILAGEELLVDWLDVEEEEVEEGEEALSHGH